MELWKKQLTQGSVDIAHLSRDSIDVQPEEVGQTC